MFSSWLRVTDASSGDQCSGLHHGACGSKGFDSCPAGATASCFPLPSSLIFSLLRASSLRLACFCSLSSLLPVRPCFAGGFAGHGRSPREPGAETGEGGSLSSFLFFRAEVGLSAVALGILAGSCPLSRSATNGSAFAPAEPGAAEAGLHCRMWNSPKTPNRLKVATAASFARACCVSSEECPLVPARRCPNFNARSLNRKKRVCVVDLGSLVCLFGVAPWATLPKIKRDKMIQICFLIIMTGSS